MSEPAKLAASSAATTEQLVVLEREYANHGDIQIFFQVVLGTHEVPFEIADAFLTEKRTAAHIRVRDIEDGILSTPRIPVGNEIKVLQDKAIELFSWYTNKEIQKTYAAPCMPIIQCSGTGKTKLLSCLLYTSPSPRDLSTSRMPSSA